MEPATMMMLMQLLGGTGGSGGGGGGGGGGTPFITPLSAIPALARTGYGAYELYKSHQYSKTPRPEYEISNALMESVGNQRRLASDRTAVTDAMMPLLDKRMSDSLRMAQDKATGSADLLGGAMGMYGANLDSLKEGAYGDLMHYTQQNQILNSLLADKLAPEQQNKWKYDKMMPYEQDMATARHLREVGLKNIFHGIDTAPYIGGFGGGGGGGSDGGRSQKQAPGQPFDATGFIPQNYGLNQRYGGFDDFYNQPQGMQKYSKFGDFSNQGDYDISRQFLEPFMPKREPYQFNRGMNNLSYLRLLNQ